MSCGGGGGDGAALRAAASAGDAAACNRLLGSLRSVRFTRDELGRSALHLAASAGHKNVVRQLLNVAAPREVDSPDGAGCTALQRAAADGHEEVVRLLLSRGADVDRQDSVHGNAAIHEAAWKGFSRTVALLASAGANLSRVNAGGFTALHLCCQNGHNQSCRELLLAGCNPDLQNNYGDTALHTAARYGHAGVTRILISAKCRVSEQNKNGDTALHIAAAMGRRKLTKILLEADCDKSIRNKQNETARDIAVRKDLNEIITILDEYVQKKDKKCKVKKRSKSKVRFDPKNADAVPEKPGKNWSPYGCHYYPDPEAFPSPRLDSLPPEPLKRGEQYYLDLAGNICKGPIGVGYTCYCAPLFRHLEARLERDKKELQKAQVKLGQRVAGLEQRLNRSAHDRRSERVPAKEQQVSTLARSRSLEMLDKNEVDTSMQGTRSMEDLDDDQQPRRSVKELVARIQQKQQDSTSSHPNHDDHSESSDDDDMPPRFPPPQHFSYDPMPADAPPRSRVGVYSPTIVNTAQLDARTMPEAEYYVHNQPVATNYRYAHSEIRNLRLCEPSGDSNVKYTDLNARFAKLRMLDSTKMFESSRELPSASRAVGSPKMYESGARIVDHPQDVADNNDSGYSTKVYGSSKGNSPSLSGGQTEGECLRSSSLV